MIRSANLRMQREFRIIQPFVYAMCRGQDILIFDEYTRAKMLIVSVIGVALNGNHP